MPPYQANPGGLYNSGVYPDSRPRIDLSPILEAVGTGTGSIIHAMMQRKSVEQQNERQRAQLELQTRAAKRDEERDTWERGFRERELTQKEAAQRRADLINGIVPATPDVDRVTDVQLPTLQAPRVSPIRQSMTPGQIPPVQMTPSAPPPSTVQQHDVTLGQPEHYDPTRAAAYVRGTEIEKIRNQARAELQDDRQAADAEKERRRLTNQMNMRVLAVEGAKAVARIRAASGGSGSGGIRGAMTAGQAESMRNKIAEGLIGYAAGSYDEAVRFLNSTDGDDLRKQGVKPQHLMWAHSQFVKSGVSSVVRMSTSASGPPDTEDIDNSVKALGNIRTRIGGSPAVPKDTGNVVLPPNKVNTPPAAKPTITKAEKDALIQKGFTEKQILERYTVGK